MARASLLHRVTAAARSRRDLPGTLRRIVAEMARDGQRGACIALINERAELYLAAWDGEVDESVQRLRLPVGRGMMGRVAAEGRPIVLADLDNPGSVSIGTRGVGTNLLTKSAIAVPIWFDGVVIGVLEMGGTRIAQFGDDDVALLESIAAAVSDAVRRVEPDKFAAEVLRHRVRELTFLQDTAAVLAESLEVDAVASALVRAAADGVGARDAVLLRLDGDTAVVQASLTGRAFARETVRIDLSVLNFATKVREASCVVAGSAAASPDVASLLQSADAVAGVPIRHGRRTTAVLLLAAEDERGLDPAQVRLLEGISHVAGLALANAESYARQRDAALRDAATGLLHRSEFQRRLASAGLGVFAILAIDVDRLRVINDTCGHEAGDVTVREIAATLVAAAPSSAVLARTGGDEFAILLAGARIAEARAVAEHLRRAMHGVAVPHGPARISVGCAASGSRIDGGTVWDAAVGALHRAKQWGRDRVEVARAPEASEVAPRWDALLIDALAARDLRAVYQPIVRLHDKVTVGYEALARLPGMAPDASVGGLFATAQSCGRSRDLDWLCRRAALQDAQAIPAGIPIFVNVGVWALLDPLHDVDQTLLLLRWAQRSSADVVLEITEREVVSDVSRLREVLGIYRHHGFRFALDDVGEGHSTLEILAAAQPEFIKLAQSMVATSTQVGPRSAVEAVLAFARGSGGEVIAEGIETADELERMRGMGVHLGQGWALGRPLEMRTTFRGAA